MQIKTKQSEKKLSILTRMGLHLLKVFQCHLNNCQVVKSKMKFRLTLLWFKHNHLFHLFAVLESGALIAIYKFDLRLQAEKSI